ncbi:hypothetical protein ACJRO7_024609 [Eucalyptus globulus]|uniref:RRM domain-containing protein n=1 Tax=Eucalyptus globulus TaxID=34317 RepID=A0ABD3K876_EUCGL
MSSHTPGEASAYGSVGMVRTIGGGMPGAPIADPSMMSRPGPIAPEMAPNGRNAGFGGPHPMEAMGRPGRETVPLPPDASSTLYVEGLPPDSTKREVAHIFRPFVGYKEVRLVIKESKHRGGDPLILCFVDFVNPACAATALSALQVVLGRGTIFSMIFAVHGFGKATKWTSMIQIPLTCVCNFLGTQGQGQVLDHVGGGDG